MGLEGSLTGVVPVVQLRSFPVPPQAPAQPLLLTAPPPTPAAYGRPLGTIVGEGCYAFYEEGANWPEIIDVVEGVVTCSNNYYRFEPSAPVDSVGAAGSYFTDTIITYYGNRAAPSMGILGQHSLQELETKLREQARVFDELNGDAGVTLAFDYIYLVADGSAYPYSHYTPRMYLFEEALAFAERKGFLSFIDLQLGYRDIEQEIRRVLPYLLKPNVHLAVDTEFYMRRRGGVPGDTLGSMDAVDINQIQSIMQQYIREHNLPDKILKVYQFDPIMLTNKDQLSVGAPMVKLLINADGVGFGGVEGKIHDYRQYAGEKRDALGIKLFLQWDARLISPEELMALDPRPNEIVYQ